MEDQSALDKKYFIDTTVYNCPFCNRRNVVYTVEHSFNFNWSNTKTCHGYLVKCSSCEKFSIHLSFTEILDLERWYGNYRRFKKYTDIDSRIFYSQPTPFFVVDSRIPRILRELITEAEGCLKMNYLTGASACMRKAIYELLVHEKIEGDDYETRIKSLKKKYPDSDPSYFDILASIQGMTSDKIHEQSWDKWDSPKLKLIIETLKSVLYDIYVVPQVKKEWSIEIQKLKEEVNQGKKGVKQAPD
jgi:transcription elongation factor Elf1